MCFGVIGFIFYYPGGLIWKIFQRGDSEVKWLEFMSSEALPDMFLINLMLFEDTDLMDYDIVFKKLEKTEED